MSAVAVYPISHFPAPSASPHMWELLGLEIDVGTVPRPPVSRALSGIKVVRAYRSQAQARTSRCTYTGKNMYQQLK